MDKKVTIEQVMTSRRNFLQMAALTAAGLGLGLTPDMAWAGMDGPWSERPKSKAESINFVVWNFGKVYEKISDQFEKDWGVKIDRIIEPNVEPQVAKLTSMYAAGDTIDTFVAQLQNIGSYIDQGIAAPLNGLPGVEKYVEDFTPLCRDIGIRDGKIWGLPYLSIVWNFIYNDELLTKAGFAGKPFNSWEELVDQCLKAKKDGIAKYPLLWVAGPGFDTLPGTWFSQVANRGGRIFSTDFKPELGPGSIARETLRWWQETFTKHDIADPDSLNLKFMPATKVFNTGKHLYLGTLHNYYINIVNNPNLSPIAGKGRIHGHPGDGKSIAVTWYYMLSGATENREWACKLLQYLAGRTKDGEYVQAVNLAKEYMLMPGYKSVLKNREIRDVWSKRVDVDKMLDIFDRGVNYADVVPAIYEPWYPSWNDMMNVELTACLRNQISADVACDNMIANVKKAKY